MKFKRILFVVLLTFATMIYADDKVTGIGKYNMLADVDFNGKVLGIYILDTESAKVKYCLSNPSVNDTKVLCTEWVTNNI